MKIIHIVEVLNKIRGFFKNDNEYNDNEYDHDHDNNMIMNMI